MTLSQITYTIKVNGKPTDSECEEALLSINAVLDANASKLRETLSSLQGTIRQPSAKPLTFELDGD